MPRNGVFDSIALAFSHMASDVSAKLGPVMGPMFGVPPAAVAPLASLVIRCHAGSLEAKLKLRALQSSGGRFGGQALTAEQLRPALQRISVAVADHPHFAHLKSHAAKAIAEDQATP
jgi:phosphate/sulfate permease